MQQVCFSRNYRDFQMGWLHITACGCLCLWNTRTCICHKFNLYINEYFKIKYIYAFYSAHYTIFMQTIFIFAVRGFLVGWLVWKLFLVFSHILVRILEAENFRLMYQLRNSKQCSKYFYLHLLNYQIPRKHLVGKRMESTCPVVQDNCTTSCQDQKYIIWK